MTSKSKSYAADCKAYSGSPVDRLDLQIKKFDQWNDAAQALIIGTAPADGLRHRFALALLQTGLEHSVGIRLLLEHRLVASALALYRPQLESYVRGLWILKCATDAQVASFADGKDVIPKFYVMTEAVDAAVGTDRLTAVRLGLWKKLNDFTHGGAIQAGQRLSTSVLQSNYNDNDALGLLEASANLACLAAVNLALTNGREDLARAIDKRFDDIFHIK